MGREKECARGKAAPPWPCQCQVGTLASMLAYLQRNSLVGPICTSKFSPTCKVSPALISPLLYPPSAPPPWHGPGLSLLSVQVSAAPGQAHTVGRERGARAPGLLEGYWELRLEGGWEVEAGVSSLPLGGSPQHPHPSGAVQPAAPTLHSDFTATKAARGSLRPPWRGCPFVLVPGHPPSAARLCPVVVPAPYTPPAGERHVTPSSGAPPPRSPGDPAPPCTLLT